MRVGRNPWLRALALAASLSGAETLRAEDRAEPPASSPTPLGVGSSYHFFGGAALGESLRFNNPYRLREELGDSAESLSLTPAYVNAKLGATTKRIGRLSHGIEVDGSFALGGVPQEVVSPSYVALYEAAPRWTFRGRAGLPIVIEPDANVGFEVGAGAVFFGTAAVGVTFDLVGSLFFGAATLETPRTAIPLLSAELGVLYDFEVLP